MEKSTSYDGRLEPEIRSLPSMVHVIGGRVTKVKSRVVPVVPACKRAPTDRHVLERLWPLRQCPVGRTLWRGLHGRAISNATAE